MRPDGSAPRVVAVPADHACFGCSGLKMRALDGEIIEECSEYLMAFLLQTPCMLYDGFNKQAPRVVTSVSPDLPHPCARCIHLSTFSLAEVPLVECDIHIARFPDTIGLCFARHEKEPS